jgi:predicted DNA-binding protein
LKQTHGLLTERAGEGEEEILKAFDWKLPRPYTGDMEVHLSPETESRLIELATLSGRTADDLVEDAVAGYLEEMAELRHVLDIRYDDLESGRVKPIDGEEVYRRLMEKTEAQRQRHRPNDHVWASPRSVQRS